MATKEQARAAKEAWLAEHENVGAGISGTKGYWLVAAILESKDQIPLVPDEFMGVKFIYTVVGKIRAL